MEFRTNEMYKTAINVLRDFKDEKSCKLFLSLLKRVRFFSGEKVFLFTLKSIERKTVDPLVTRNLPKPS